MKRCRPKTASGSLKRMAGKFLSVQWLGVGVAHDAQKNIRMWTKRNRTFLRVVDLLKLQAGVRICVDSSTDASLEP